MSQRNTTLAGILIVAILAAGGVMFWTQRHFNSHEKAPIPEVVIPPPPGIHGPG